MPVRHSIARAVLVPLLCFACALPLLAATRETEVPNNFFNFYVGFNSVQNVKNEEKVALTTFRINREFTFNSLEAKNSIWGGMAGGHWFTQAPVSLGLSMSFDIFPVAIPSQTTTDFTLKTNYAPDVALFAGGVKKDPTSMVQMVPGFNVLVGIPLKFFRIYAGAGPGIFATFYTFTFAEGTSSETQLTATDTKVGLNAFAGVDFFISKRISVFAEGKFSKVNDLTFESPAFRRADGRTNVEVTETFDSLETQRAAVGMSVHF